MSKAKRAMIVFIVTCLVMCFVFWMSGYNFDHRNADVGAGTLITLVMALTVGIFSCLDY